MWVFALNHRSRSHLYVLAVLCSAMLGLSLPIYADQSTKNIDIQSRNNYPHATEKIGNVRQIYDGVLSPELAVNTFRNIDRLFPSALVRKSKRPYLLPVDPKPLT